MLDCAVRYKFRYDVCVCITECPLTVDLFFIAQCSATMLLRRSVLRDYTLSLDTLNGIRWTVLLRFAKASRFFRPEVCQGHALGPNWGLSAGVPCVPAPKVRSTYFQSYLQKVNFSELFEWDFSVFTDRMPFLLHNWQHRRVTWLYWTLPAILSGRFAVECCKTFLNFLTMRNNVRNNTRTSDHLETALSKQ